MQGFEIKFNVYANDQNEADNARNAIVSFINNMAQHPRGGRPTHDELDVVGLLTTALHQDGRGTGIGLGGAEQIERGGAHADHKGEHEPRPVTQAEHQHVEDAQRVVGYRAAQGRGCCIGCLCWHSVFI